MKLSFTMLLLSNLQSYTRKSSNTQEWCKPTWSALILGLHLLM